jgi:hypothetical protein
MMPSVRQKPSAISSSAAGAAIITAWVTPRQVKATATSSAIQR